MIIPSVYFTLALYGRPTTRPWLAWLWRQRFDRLWPPDEHALPVIRRGPAPSDVAPGTRP